MGPLSPLIALSKQKLIFPFYHGLWTFPLPHIEHVYQMLTPKQFEKDLDYLLKYFEPISLPEVLEMVKSKKPLEKNCFHLSFDDGLRSCYDLVRPILLKKGIPATFFVNSDFVDNRSMFYRYKSSLLIHAIQHKAPSPKALEKIAHIFDQKQLQEFQLTPLLLAVSFHQRDRLDQVAEALRLNFSVYLNRERPYMDTQQIQTLFKEGFTLGGHSESHPYFSDLEPNEQVLQCLNSVAYIEKKWGTDYRVFSFPFTDVGVPKSVFRRLYAQGIDATFGTAGLKQDEFPENLQRIPMEKLQGAKRTLWKAYSSYFPKAILNRNLVIHP